MVALKQLILQVFHQPLVSMQELRTLRQTPSGTNNKDRMIHLQKASRRSRGTQLRPNHQLFPLQTIAPKAGQMILQNQLLQ
jgi:hypothetical protein